MRGIKSRGENNTKKIFIFVILLVISLLLLNSVYKVYRKKVNAKQALVVMQQELQALKEREIFLKDSLNRLETREGMEFELRQKLNVALEGERVAIIVDENEEKDKSVEEKSLWQKIKSTFFD